MSRCLTSASALLLALLVVDAAHAAIVTVDGSIKLVDAEKRTITVQTKAKTLELDVSRKAKVSVKGIAAKLDSLKAGQKVKISYHDGLDVVVTIEVIGKEPSSPETPDVELVELKELNSAATSSKQVVTASSPWLSANGLTIYWEDSGIWTARRQDADSFFENKKRLFAGRHPTVTAAGLEMVLLVDGLLHSTSRQTDRQQFKRPRLIRELKTQPRVKNPCLSRDGLKLYFNRSQNGSEIVICSRDSRTSPWTAPKSIQFRRVGSDGAFTWPFFSKDEKTLFCSHEISDRLRNGKGNLMIWTRKDDTGPFSKYEYVEFPDIEPLMGRSPRYVAATKELFFHRVTGPKQGRGIWVVKNYVPPESGE